MKWAAVHRRHHQYSDAPDDPHSPHRYGRGLWGLICGFWHAHVGWVFNPDPADLDRYRVAEGRPTVGSGDGQRDHSVRYASPKNAPTASATLVGCT